MDLLQLKYFCRLAELQHVTRTAQELNISQPSLSITVRKLEKELGAPLFLREGRNISLSPYGKAFLEYVEPAMMALENGRSAVMDMWNKDDLSLTIGILDPYSWRDIIHGFTASYPNVSLNVLSIDYAQYIDSLLDGRLDLYVGGVNGLQSSKSDKIAVRVLNEYDMAIVMSKSHPLAGGRA